MTTQLAFDTPACGANGSVTHGPLPLAGRAVCTRKSAATAPAPHSIAASTGPADRGRRTGGSKEFGRRSSLATRVEVAFAVVLLIALAAVESYFIAHAILGLQAPPEPRAAAVAAATAPPAREGAPFSPESSRLSMLVTVASYLASGLGGSR